MIIFTEEQKQSIQTIYNWYRSIKRKQTFIIHGPAGVGKSTIVKAAIENLGLSKVNIGTLTGKAALVLRRRGVPAQTIHSMIYRWIEEDDTGKPAFVLNRESALRDADLLVLDECGMISEDLAEDLLSFEVPTLVLGDPHQLPPIRGEGFFDAEPDVLLTEVHRQALGSPILRLATTVREGGTIPEELREDGLEITSKAGQFEKALGYDQIVCGTHAMRRRINSFVRRVAGRTSPIPEDGEKVICLRNERDSGLVNGCFIDVSEARFDARDPSEFEARVRTEEGSRLGRRAIYAGYFMDHQRYDPDRRRPRRGAVQADFGYAITCHKAQGSGYEGVAIIDDGWGKTEEDRRRWLYTAITRAEDRLLLVRRG